VWLCTIAVARLITLGRAACFVAWMRFAAQVHAIFPEVVVVIIRRAHVETALDGALGFASFL
jgi:hypothetical protein